jgi:hypothetical protein
MKYHQTKRLFNQFWVALILVFSVACGGGSGGDPDPVEPPQADTTPDAFTLTDRIDVELDTLTQSDPITISGIDAATSISISGGEYSIDGGTFVSTSGTVTNGQSVIVQQTSSSTSKTTTDTVLTVGGVSDTFSVTTILVLNANFVEKTEIVSINQVNLFENHIDIDDRDAVSLDVSTLRSGDLFTVDVEFDISDLLVDDFIFSVQLMPESVVSQFEIGTTLGEVIIRDYVADEGEEIINLGVAQAIVENTGTHHAVLQTKIPALSQDIDYRLVITPDFSFLASGEPLQREELALTPIFIKPEILNIQQLDGVILNVIENPKLLNTNDFTHVEIASTFDSNGFSSKPIFQTHLEVDVTSFNENETLELSLNWTTSKGDTFELGLMSIDENGETTVTEKPQFQVARDGAKSVQIPILAFLTESAHADMLAFSTSIRDIADQTPESANFVLSVASIENNTSGVEPLTFDLNLPMVKQDLRPTIQSDSDIIKYTVLRAGNTNSACLQAIPDIDSGFFTPNISVTIQAVACSAGENQLWRYDFQTSQLIHKITDENGNNFCLEMFGLNILPDTYRLSPCRFDPVNINIGRSAQRFLFESGEPIIGEQVPLYLDVNFSNATVQSVSLTQEESEAPNFFSDSEGVDIDRNGRLFYVGDFSELSIGNAEFAQAGINYGGEAYIDYQPVAGIGATGSAELFVSFFEQTLELASASFDYQRHLSKQLTSLSGNISPVEVKNGKEAKFVLLGVETTLGEMETSTITESYNPLENLATFLTAEEDPEEIADIDLGNDDFDQELFSSVLVVFGVPVTLEGRVEGELTLKGSLNELQPFGLSADLESKMLLEATLSASVDAFIASAGLEGTVTVIDKTFSFDQSGQFSASDDFALLEPEIKFSAEANLELELDILKGKVVLFGEFPKPCVCFDLFKMVRKEKTLFESDSLFSYDNNFIEGSAVELEFKL